MPRALRVRVDAMIANPNGYKIHVLDPDVDLFLNGKFVGKGILDTAWCWTSKSYTLYSVPLHADLKGGSLLMIMLSGALNGGKFLLGAKGTVVGKAGLDPEALPLRVGGGVGVLVGPREHPSQLGSQRVITS